MRAPEGRAGGASSGDSGGASSGDAAAGRGGPGDGGPPRRRRPFLARLLGVLGRGLAALLGVVLLLAAAVLFAATQTSPGRERVRSLVEDAIQGAVSQGRVEIGRVTGGNLLTRAVIDRFAIYGPEGDVFVVMDSVRLEYDPLGFLGGNFTFRDVWAQDARLRLVQSPEGVWNFDRIFGGEEEPGARQGDIRMVIRDLQVSSGHIEIRQPFVPDLEGAARDSAISAAVRGEAIWRVERSEEGVWQQVYELESVEGLFPLARLVHPTLPMTILIDRLSGTLKAVTQPLDILRFDGSLVFRDTIRVDIDRARFGHSELRGGGWMAPGDPLDFRFEIRADPAGFADLQWLPVPVPEEGGGPMDLVLRARGETTVVEVRDARVEVRDSEMRGSFVLALEETPTFDSLDLTLDPLRIQLVDRLLERPEIVDGYISGRVEGQGPIDALRVDGAVTLRDLEGETAPSGLEAEGRIGIVEPFPMRDLTLGFERFDPRWAGLLGFDVDLAGRIHGTTTLTGSTVDRLAFEADVRHVPTEGPESHLVGAGTFGFDEPYTVEASATLDPLSLALLDPYLPDLEPVGTVRGPVSVSGSLAALSAEADLQTPRGRLTFEGDFDLAAERKRYDAQVTARDVDLDEWAARFPESSLAVRGRVQGVGTDPATLEARFDLEILPSTFAEARVDTSLLRFTVREGLATVDTFAVRTDVGRVAGRGGFGLVADRSGSLILDVDVSDLSAWNRWLVEGRTGPGPSPRPDDLFEDFPTPPGVAADEEGQAAPADTVAGTLSARGVLFGNVEDFSFGGRLQATSATYGAYSVDSLVARVDVTEPRTLDSLVVNATAWELRGLGIVLDSLSTRLSRAGAGLSDFRLAAAADTTLRAVAVGGVEWEEERKVLALDTLFLSLGRQELVLDDSARIALLDGGLAVEGLALAGGAGARLRADGRIPETGEASFELEIEQLRLGELLAPYPGAPDVGGTLTASLDVAGTAAAPRMEGFLELRDPRIGSVGYRLIEGDFEYRNGAADGRLALHGRTGVLARAQGTVRADLAFEQRERRLPEDAFDLQVVADSLPLSVVELTMETLRDVSGWADGEVRVTGGLEALRAHGAARLVNGGARVPGLGVRFRQVEGEIAFEGAEARLDSIGFASSAGGTGVVRGTVGLSEIRDPTFDLGLRARRLRVMDRQAMTFEINADVELEGSYRTPALTGQVRVFNGDIRQEDLLRRREVIDLTDPEVYALIDTTLVSERRLLEAAQNPFMQNLRLNLALTVGPDLWLRSEVLDVEVAGEGLDLRMDRAEQQLVLFGTLRLVRGTYVFSLPRFPLYRQQLRIIGGTIEFVGTPGLNPNLEIRAAYRTRTPQGPVEVVAVIGGTMQDTELTLQSDPPLSESDQLCFLALGSPCLEAVDQSLGQRLAREAILGGVSQTLSSALVGDLGLDLLTLRSTAGGGQLEAGAEGFFAQTQIEIGKYIGNDFFLTLAQPLGNRAPEASIEWRFTEDWTLEARVENRFARAFGLSAASALEFDQTFGVFIFREWSF